MPERRTPRFDPYKRFALDAGPEDVLRRLLDSEDVFTDENDTPRDEDG